MTLHRRILLVAAAVGSALGLLLALSTPALAASDAYVRLAHLSPDTPNVDVYVSSVADPRDSFVVPGVGYGAVSPYRALAPGSYVVSMRGAGAAADSPPVISIVAAIFLPLVLLYQGWTYYVFRQRLSGEPVATPVAAVGARTRRAAPG